jgi:sugar phosphate isomerase/epimerase
MAQITRRKFMEQTAMMAGAAGVMAHGAVEVGTGPLGFPIGSQVWPMRSMLKDFRKFVKMLADIGVTRLELCSPIGYGEEFSSLKNPKEVVRILSDHGMKSESSHFMMSELRQSHQKSIDWAKEIGITQMITATLGDGNGGSHPTLEQVKKAAEEYNKIAAFSARAGLQQGLHNEGFEMATVDGKQTYDLLFELLDPKLVKFQFQMSTIAAGFVAADYFTRYPGRFYSIHLQDIDLQAPVERGDDGSPRGKQVALGKGSIDWAKTFQAAKSGGVQNYFVEQNWEMTQQSVAFLKGLKF